MTICVYPADRFGCGMFRLAWPAQQLQDAGHPVRVMFPDQRWDIAAKINNRTGEVVGAVLPDGCETVVLQRVTHRHLVGCIPFWQEQGARVVVDVDDDLSSIHPSNKAFQSLRPSQVNKQHSWANLQRACQLADAVTVTTPALARRYRADAFVLPNYLPDHYYGLGRIDNDDLMWPASLHTHPNDAEVLGSTLQRVVRESEVRVRMLGDRDDEAVFQRVFGLTEPPVRTRAVGIDEWPNLLASIGVAFVPLADTRFNEAKSWLKLLELSAAGVPWVASPRADYRRFRQLADFKVGAFAERPSDWRRELKALLASADLRAEQSAAGREAAELFRLRDHNWRWAEVWTNRSPRPRVRGLSGAALGLTV